jgi:hypothetical protein
MFVFFVFLRTFVPSWLHLALVTSTAEIAEQIPREQAQAMAGVV